SDGSHAYLASQQDDRKHLQAARADFTARQSEENLLHKLLSEATRFRRIRRSRRRRRPLATPRVNAQPHPEAAPALESPKGTRVDVAASRRRIPVPWKRAASSAGRSAPRSTVLP